MNYELPNLIESIRTALAFSEFTSPDKLAEHAAKYARECVQINERLQRCLPHLRSGNNAEAVRLAEISPNVVETYNLLDFDKREDWIEVCDALGLTVPPPLVVEVFQELNDAYLQNGALEPLLKWHRLYALNGSPLRDRLTVLRSLAQADPMNLFWETDQEIFEKARIKEIGKDVDNALAQKNISLLQELYRELTAPGWQIAPPPEYKWKICTAVLEKHADELMKHFAAFDNDEAEAAYQSMRQVLSANQMAMPPSIDRNIRPAVQWLWQSAEEEKALEQFQENVDLLQDALENGMPRQDLENRYYQLHHAAVKASQSVPPNLEKSYRNRIAYLSQVEKNRNWIVVTAFAGALILVAAAIVYGLVDRALAEQVNQTLATLQKIETEHRIEEIGSTLKTIKPKIAQSPEVAAAMGRLQEMLDQDNTRAKDFEHYRSQADSLLELNPDDSERWKAVQSSVDQADKKKRTDQEITSFTALRSKYDRMFSQWQSENDRAFGNQLSQYRREFDNLPQLPNDDYPLDKLIERFDTLNANIQQLSLQFSDTDISERQRQERDRLLASIANRQKTVQQSTAETEAFHGLPLGIFDLSSYKKALETFSRRFPSHPATDNIKKLLEDFDTIQESAELLQTLSRKYVEAAGDFQKLRSTAAGMKKEFTTIAAKMTETKSVFAPSDFYEVLADSKPIDDNTFSETKKLLELIAQIDLYPWIDEKKYWYYLTEKPLDDAGKLVKDLEYVTNLTADVKNKYDPKTNNAQRNIGNYGLIQSTFSRQTLVQLDQFITQPETQDNASEIVGEIFVKMLDAPGIDPILKVILFHNIILEYAEADPIFAKNFDRILQLIADQDMDMLTNWMDVDTDLRGHVISGQRGKADTVLYRIDDLQSMIKKTTKEIETFRKAVTNATPRFELTGMLQKQGLSWSYAVIRDFPAKNGTLVVLQDDEGKVKPTLVGKVSNGAVQLENTIAVLQCSPVFFVGNE